jgi:hypothetical protein
MKSVTHLLDEYKLLRWAQWGATIEVSRFNRKCPGHRAGLFVLAGKV